MNAVITASPLPRTAAGFPRPDSTAVRMRTDDVAIAPVQPWLLLIRDITATQLSGCRTGHGARVRAEISARPDSSRSLFAMPFSPKRAGSIAYSMAMFAIVSVLAGVLVAGLFVPVAGLIGCRQQGRRRRAEQPPGRAGDPDAAHPIAGADGQRQDPRLLLRREPHPGHAEEHRPGDAPGAARHRGPPVLRARRAGREGHVARAGPQHGQRRRAPRAAPRSPSST